MNQLECVVAIIPLLHCNVVSALSLHSSAHLLPFFSTHALFVFVSTFFKLLGEAHLSGIFDLVKFQRSILTVCPANNTRLPRPMEQILLSTQSLSMRLAHQSYTHVATCLRHTACAHPLLCSRPNRSWMNLCFQVVATTQILMMT